MPRATSKFAARRGIPNTSCSSIAGTAGAFLERHEQDWPETFDLKISGQRDAILCVSLIPEGYGEMHLLALSRKKEATYFNARGECLDDKPAADAFRIETADTPTGVAVTVTLPPGARLVRRLEVKYYSTWW